LLIFLRRDPEKKDCLQARGTSTLRFDEAGKPLTAALPFGETPWVRITAVGTDDGSAGVQFGIIDFTVAHDMGDKTLHAIELLGAKVLPRMREMVF
jgi:arabinofuranan 3-O-arabinosyltransferase